MLTLLDRRYHTSGRAEAESFGPEVFSLIAWRIPAAYELRDLALLPSAYALWFQIGGWCEEETEE